MQMRNKRHMRTLSLLLAAALLVGQLGATAYAEGPPSAGGLCEHHTAHDAACGYVEAVEGHACEHEHTPECYTDELICGDTDGDVQTASGSDAGHQHGQTCYKLDCPHERGAHDDACGYIEGVKGTPCGNVCTECGGEPDKDSGTISGNNLPAPVETAPGTVEPEDAGTIRVMAFDELGGGVKVQTVLKGTELESLTLPVTLGASGYTVSADTEPVPEPITITGVMWELTGENNSPTVYEDGRETPCSYYFQPILPEGYTLDKNAALPKIEVRYGWGTRANTNDYDTGDVTAFQNFLNDNTKLKEALEQEGINPQTPATWATNEVVTWDNSSPKKITGLKLTSKLSDEGSTLDLSSLSVLDKLTSLECSDNELTELTGLSGLSQLEKLYCLMNELKTLDVSSLSALKMLNCMGNKLETLDVSSLSNLTSLYCRLNPLTSLKLQNGHTLTIKQPTPMVSVQSITLAENKVKLTALSHSRYRFESWVGLPADATINGNEAEFVLNNDETVEAVYFSLYDENDMAAFQKILDEHPTLISGKVDRDNPDTWDASKGDLVGWGDSMPFRIIRVSLTDKGLEGSLDVSGLLALKKLECAENELETLNVSGLSALEYLDCHTNKLETLNVSGLSALEVLTCDSNKLETLDVSGTALTELYCNTNELKELKGVSGQSALNTLFCYRNKLKALNVTGTALTMFLCYENELTELKGVSDLTDLDFLSCRSNQLEKWDLLRCSKLQNLCCEGNTILLSDGTIKAGSGGKVRVNFGKEHIYDSIYPFTLTALPDSGHTFDYWTGLPDSGKSKDNPVSFTPGAGYTYTAHFVSTKSDNNNSTSDDDSEPRHYTITTPQPPKPDNPVLAVIDLSVSGSPATGKTSDGDTSAAMAEAQRTAKRKGREQYGIAVQYDAKTTKTYDGFSIVIRRATLDRLIDPKNNVKWLTVNTSIADLTFTPAALKEIADKSTGDITLTATRETGLAGDALAAVGSRPAYRLTVGYTGADGKAATVSDFGAGSVTVGLAYTPAATEQAGGLYLVYSKDGKGAEWLYRSGHDANSGNVIGSTGHFSVYGVGYKPAPAFTDTVNHWAKADIDFVASRGLLTGTGDTTFTPDGTITRGMFVTALGRLAGIDPAAYPSSSRFADVPANAYYAPYVEWAAGRGIVNGTGEKSFSPDAVITREQMAAIMQRYADKLGYVLPVAREGEIFADDAKITGSMKDAVQAMQQAGIMSGKGGHRFGPKDTATRAEAAAVLRRFVKIVIDRTTAGGWAQNETGRWLYYLDAKPLTGWNQIENKWYYFDAAGLMEYGGWKEIGGKWYYFYPDGAMAANTTIDGYEIGPDGKRKEKED